MLVDCVRLGIILLLGSSVALVPVHGSAQTVPAGYPNRAVTIVVPFPAGGGTDVMFRAVQARLQTELNVPVVVDNRTGAGGTLGTGIGARAQADGYTLTAGTTTTISAAQAVYPKLSYDPMHDLVPIGTIGTSPFMLVVANALPVASVMDFVNYAKAHPDRINYGSGGKGTLGHLAGELFKQKTKTQMTHIPYRGAAPAQADLMAGQIQATFDNPTSLVQQIRASKFRALAISEPSAALPGLPTFEEAGLKDYKPMLWYGLFAPAGTPRDIVVRLGVAIDRVVNDPAFKADLLSKGVTPLSLTATGFSEKIQSDARLWGDIARAVDARAE